MMKRLHETLNIPLEELVELDPVPWKKRPKPQITPAEKNPARGRGDTR
jgi:hypothetical protein